MGSRTGRTARRRGWRGLRLPSSLRVRDAGRAAVAAADLDLLHDLAGAESVPGAEQVEQPARLADGALLRDVPLHAAGERDERVAVAAQVRLRDTAEELLAVLQRPPTGLVDRD